jgi:hypothetical protein
MRARAAGELVASGLLRAASITIPRPADIGPITLVAERVAAYLGLVSRVDVDKRAVTVQIGPAEKAPSPPCGGWGGLRGSNP